MVNCGWMAERSKAPVLGTGLFGGASSNLAPINLDDFMPFWFYLLNRSQSTNNSLGQKKKKGMLKPPGIRPHLGSNQGPVG